MDKIKVNRIKQILEGDFTSSTSIHTGYTPNQNHAEGDEWEEHGKKWKLKNGIQCSISKFTELRKNNAMPLFCPKCGIIMSHHLDEKFWRIRNMCFNCTIIFDTQLMAEGKFDEYSDKKIKQNIITYLEQKEFELHDYLANLDVQQFITERGDIEDWVQPGMNAEQIKEKILSSYNEMKQQLLDSVKDKEE
jgi:ribosomal protein S27AE